MDVNITKALNDKLYDKRKSGALELEEHRPPGSGLQAGLGAAHLQLDPLAQLHAEVAHQASNGSWGAGTRYPDIPTTFAAMGLACFGDQDARVRYYACESMYNIAKVAKGEILVYFNHVFDALCKVRTWLPHKLPS